MELNLNLNGKELPLKPVSFESGNLEPIRRGTLSFDGLISTDSRIESFFENKPSPVGVEFGKGELTFSGTAFMSELKDTTPKAKTLKKRLKRKGLKVLKLTFKRPKHKSYSGSFQITSID